MRYKANLNINGKHWYSIDLGEGLEYTDIKIPISLPLDVAEMMKPYNEREESHFHIFVFEYRNSEDKFDLNYYLKKII